MSDSIVNVPFPSAVEALTVQAQHEGPAGWYLHVRARQQLQTWQESDVSVYSSLSTEELFDVLVAELAAALGL